ncbi:MAG: bifunctional GNAT family N-acetyltransferase/carbon-nitrogen hydrolase family protein [Leptospiraceae bacterium]|nr:bifunctional GNAT family N-acetyltransferase/carbon-nitrogen hydrolase family protein [Leptospiraceae bacterium]
MEENKAPRKEIKRVKKNSPHKLILRKTQSSDYEAIKDIMNKVYSNAGGTWTKEEFTSQLKKFPEGQFCIEDKGRLVAAVVSMIVNYADFGDKHTYDQITSKGYLTNHNPDGDTLYGVDMFVDPNYQGLRLGRRLYDARKEICFKMNLKRIIVGGRIPGYKSYSHKLSPQEYVELVKNKEIFDNVLSFQLKNDFHVRKIMTDYFPEDTDSKSFATLLEWINIYYEEKEQLLGGMKSVIRLGIVQWQMRSVDSLQEFMRQVEFFVDAVAGYKADFVLFPEFFNVPLMAQFNKQSPADAIRSLAEYTEQIREGFVNLAISYNINIIAGTMPVYTDSTLYNVSYLCKRDGTYEEQFKIHITPDENNYWGMKGGNEIRVFETDVCKIGILICYDVEFPELPRILASKGMQILFVPFSTDTKNAYNRVRYCAQARAIENECYVAISGSVGNLPDVESMDIQYAQSAVFSPSDYAFGHDAIAAEATPNTEMTLIVDVDLDLLKELNSEGSVRNLNDRRHDLYKLHWLGGSVS